MNILYIAYSCSPDHGSEDRIGWKIPVFSAKTNKVIVITKQEHEQSIREYRALHPELDIRFYFVDIPAVWKKLFRGPVYSGRLNIWQKRALALAEQLCSREKIDVIHQITPVEFRSIGDYGRIPNVKYVCGPVGGGEYIPKGLQFYARRHLPEEILRGSMNRIRLHGLRRNGVLDRCDALLFANEETKAMLRPLLTNTADEYRCMTEIGIDDGEILRGGRKGSGTKCTFLVAGRLLYRKGHELLLDAMSRLPDTLDFRCVIAGSGRELDRLRKKSSQLGLDSRVEFPGRVSFGEMARIYADADVLVMPSIRETTGSVLLEAMARGLPVIAIDRFGGSTILDGTTGWLYGGGTREEYIRNLAACLTACITCPDQLRQRGENAALAARRYTWDEKMENYQQIYTKLMGKSEEKDG